MTFNLPFYALILPYAIFLLIFVILSIVSLVDLISHSANDAVSFLITFLFLAATIIVVFESWQLLSQFDWTRMMPINLPTFWPASL